MKKTKRKSKLHLTKEKQGTPNRIIEISAFRCPSALPAHRLAEIADVIGITTDDLSSDK